MKKLLTRIAILILGFVFLCSFSSCLNTNEEKINTIPQNNISYTHLEFGNVIDEGKRAVFFNFTSDYIVSKMEIEGILLDRSGNTIYTFEDTISFGSPSNNPKFPIRIDENLVKNVSSVSFTKMKAYTTQELNSNN